MKFYEKLQQLRRERGLSQEMLSEMLGVSRQAVSKWESGQTYPEMDKLIAISEIFGVTLDSLIKDDEPLRTDPPHQGAGYPPYRPFWRSAYEYKSKRTLFGLPLVHVHFGWGLKDYRNRQYRNGLSGHRRCVDRTSLYWSLKRRADWSGCAGLWSASRYRFHRHGYLCRGRDGNRHIRLGRFGHRHVFQGRSGCGLPYRCGAPRLRSYRRGARGCPGRTDLSHRKSRRPIFHNQRPSGQRGHI